MRRIIFTILICHAILGQGIRAQENDNIPALPPDEEKKTEYLKHAAELESLKSFFQKTLQFPEDPAKRLILANKLEQYQKEKSWLATYVKSTNQEKDSLRAVSLSTSIDSLLPRLQEIEKSTPLPLAEAYHKTGLRHLELGDTLDALTAFRKSIDANENYSPARKDRAKLHLDQNNPEDAIEDALALSRLNQPEANIALTHVFHDFTRSIVKTQDQENHSWALALIDSLLIAYEGDEIASNILIDMRSRSRQAIISSYRSVAQRALNGGKVDLALRYREMALKQEEEWDIQPSGPDNTLFGEITVYAARSALMAMENGAIPHAMRELRQADSLFKEQSLPKSLDRKYRQLIGMIGHVLLDSMENSTTPNRFYAPWSWLADRYPELTKVQLARERNAKSIQGKETGKPERIPYRNNTSKNLGWLTEQGTEMISGHHLKAVAEDILDWIASKQDHAEYLAWKGDTASVQDYLDTLKMLTRLPNEKIVNAALSSLNGIQEEINAWSCRQREQHYDDLEREFRSAISTGSWTTAAQALSRMQETRSVFPDCELPSLPSKSTRKLVSNAFKYQELFTKAEKAMNSGRQIAADSLLESAEMLFTTELEQHSEISRIKQKDWITRYAPREYLIHAAEMALDKGSLDNSIGYIEAFRQKDGEAKETSTLQISLGKALAEKDLASTTLTNPMTLLDKHIPLVPWYKELRKAYRKRFRKG